MGFCDEFGYADEVYFAAFVRMFEQALSVAITLPTSDRDDLIQRLDLVRSASHNFGYGVGADLDSLMAAHSKREV